ncbi:WD40/YVTN/BNR-like repeat-containing protein [Halopseudomonas maritima]|uniref:WD40/YVTN/BNR-like repeat-containing protein n=1 Tax=Halopseudomonas maritima TaxID=2918528 RepID=UPI001EEC45C7|nr:YCF48-related protein [Halopseudomonas maritima]UJJ31543.1 glycosyl hydrolase [Halopseudomonas maritima]
MSKLISYSFCLVVAALVFYAFSPRHDGAAGELDMDLARVQFNDLVHFNDRMVAVGERGTIIVSDDDGDTWRETHNDQQLPVTLTGVSWLGGELLLAVGHDELMLRSEDGGDSWTPIMHDKEVGEPLMGTWSADGKQIFAYGSFGRFFKSNDRGQTWSPVELDIHGEHLNDMAGDGERMQLLVGEMGLVMRSEDGGQQWELIEPFYRGSLFGVAHLRDSNWVAYGMRGHVFVSRDDGSSWAQVELPHQLPLYGHASDAKGVVIVGTGGAYVALGRDGELQDLGFLRGLGTLTSAVVLPNSEFFVAGQYGLQQRDRDYLAYLGQ